MIDFIKTKTLGVAKVVLGTFVMLLSIASFGTAAYKYGEVVSYNKTSLDYEELIGEQQRRNYAQLVAMGTQYLALVEEAREEARQEYLALIEEAREDTSSDAVINWEAVATKWENTTTKVADTSSQAWGATTTATSNAWNTTSSKTLELFNQGRNWVLAD